MAQQTRKTALLAGIALMLAACGSETDDIETANGVTDRSGDALAEIVGDVGTISIAADAFERTGLSGVLEGEASYTIMAPTDAAFERLGENAQETLENEERGAIVAAVLRDHMVPGALTPDAIRTAIEENGGEVSMATFGSGALTLSLDGETIVVSNGAGQSANIAGDPVVGQNGVVIPIDGVLVDPEALLGADGG
ncbi:fasciclin domain-containing protein [Erythrobacter rubeus]|uniref:Fasciclin domain-containing protein n=1 Tax=Erythrobacter rubeus TaxID=2760803 RepID=A0ABR8KPE0_9SPHN|nr:fasciclin domain-containing protein [Erythrobacter rubeus]MBD2842529.1 fasciclin domain-containing protein [Erythrobacter rubeus]